MAANEGILLRSRPGGCGVDVEYRPRRVAALLLGRDVDDAIRVAARCNQPHGAAHAIALARAVPGDALSDARRAAWELALLATAARAEADRAVASLAGGEALAAPAAGVRAAADALEHALGQPGGPRGILAPDGDALRAAAGELAHALTNLVIRLSAIAPARLAELVADARELVEGAWAAPAALLKRVRRELPPLAETLAPEPPLPVVIDAEGTGSAVTTNGRITYGLGVAAGCVSRVQYSAPSDRLFKPGGVAVQLFDRLGGDVRTLSIVMAALDPGVPWSVAGAEADA